MLFLRVGFCNGNRAKCYAVTCEAINEYLRTRIDAGDFPSAVYLVAENGEIVYYDALGCAVVEPERIKATKDTIYDLASLTKPLVTGLLLATQIQTGAADLDTRILDSTVKQLATHSAGLPAWTPLYRLAPSSDQVVDAIKQFDRRPTNHVEYSDIGYIMLGAHADLRAFDRDVSAKLRLGRTGFNPLEKGFALREIAATEKGSGHEKQMCKELGYWPPADAGGSDPFRKHLIWGEVHDGNAYFMGGVAGHAGLFSTAEEVFKIALQFLPQYTQLLKPETCESFRTNFTKGMNEDRSFAFQLASTKDSTAGTKMSPESFGHNGFTGTSLWIDPVKDRIFILLTNRTHNRELPFANINAVRRRFHDLAIDCLDGNN